MKKTILALSVLLIVFAGFLFPNMSSANAQAEQVPEDVLRITEYETEEGTFKEVRNLQEYRQLLSEQGLSDYEVSVRMLKASGYTQEQIDEMPEEAILQNLDVKDSRLQLTQAEPETPMTRAAASVVQGLNLAISYRTIELSKYVDGRDPKDFLLLSAHFDWSGATDGMPAFRSNDFLAIYNYPNGQEGVSFDINSIPPHQSFPSYEVFSGRCKNSSGGTVTLEGGVVQYAQDYSIRIAAFKIPTGNAYKDVSGYYQVLGEIDPTVQALQRFRVVYGHSYQTMEVSYSVSVGASVSTSGFGISGGISKQFTPTTKIDSSTYRSLNYIYTPNTLDGIYTIQNVSSSRPMEVLGNNTATVTQAATAFNKNLASHRQNSAWQFDVFPVTTSDGLAFTIKSVATWRYLSTFANGERGLRTSYSASRFYIQGNQYGEQEPCFEIIPTYDETKVLTAQGIQPLIYLAEISGNYNTSDWFFIPVADEDVGTKQTSYDPLSNDVYKLKNVGTGKYVEIPDYNANREVYATMATASSQKTCQEFRLRISSGAVQFCPNHMIYHRLDVEDGSSAAGTKVWQYSANNTDAQKFLVQPEKLVNGVMRFRIYTFSSGLSGVLQANTSDVTQETYSASKTNQLWELVYQYTPEIDMETSSYFTFRNVKSGHFLDVRNNGTQNGTDILQYNFKAGNNQQWQIEHLGDGLQIIKTRLNTNCVLDIDRSKNRNGTKVQLWTYEGNKNQKFKIVQRYRGQYIIYANTSNFTKGLSVKDGSMDSGAIVHQWEYTGTRELWTVNKFTTSVYLYDCSYIRKLTIGINGAQAVYFYPPKTGSYTIETVGEIDTTVKLYDSNGTLLTTKTSNAGLGNNEKFSFNLTAGKKYTIEVRNERTENKTYAGLLIY